MMTCDVCGDDVKQADRGLARDPGFAVVVEQLARDRVNDLCGRCSAWTFGVMERASDAAKAAKRVQLERELSVRRSNT